MNAPASVDGGARMMTLLRSAQIEEQLAGLMLLARQADAATNVDAHVAIRPLLHSLLSKPGSEYARVAVSVLAASCTGGVPLTTEDAEKFVPVLATLLLRPDSDKDTRDAAITCLLHCLALPAVAVAEAVRAALYDWCAQALRASTAAAPTPSHDVDVVTVLALTSALVRHFGLPHNASGAAIVTVSASILARNQTEAKFDALALLTDCLLPGSAANDIPKSALDGKWHLVKSIVFFAFHVDVLLLLLTCCGAGIAADTRAGLLDILRARKRSPQITWAALSVCAAMVSRVGLAWVVAKGDGVDFFGLLMGLVGVEVAMSFDDVTAPPPPVLQPCTKLLELVMTHIDTVGNLMQPGQILAFRDKLGDVCRVALLFVTEDVERAQNDPERRNGACLPFLLLARNVSDLI